MFEVQDRVWSSAEIIKLCVGVVVLSILLLGFLRVRMSGRGS
jgi:hypothetical protein